jgi:long-chain acyl-CoA synthetase
MKPVPVLRNATSEGGYKKPRSVDFVDDLPKNASGKVLKKVLREKYWQGRERTIA